MVLIIILYKNGKIQGNLQWSSQIRSSSQGNLGKLAKGADSITHEEFKVAAEAMAKTLNLPGMNQPTEEEKAAAKKLADPNGTGKINFEGFKALVHAGIEKGRKEGKI